MFFSQISTPYEIYMSPRLSMSFRLTFLIHRSRHSNHIPGRRSSFITWRFTLSVFLYCYYYLYTELIGRKTGTISHFIQIIRYFRRWLQSHAARWHASRPLWFLLAGGLVRGSSARRRSSGRVSRTGLRGELFSHYGRRFNDKRTINEISNGNWVVVVKSRYFIRFLLISNGACWNMREIINISNKFYD